VRANQQKGSSSDSDVPADKPLTDDESAWLNQPDVQRGLKVVREHVLSAPDNFRPTLNLELDLGLDSMQRVELLSHLEEELGGNVEESQLAAIYTLRDLLDAVLQSSARGESGKPRAAFAGWKAILAEDPTDPEVLALSRPLPTFPYIWYPISRVVQMIARDLFDLRVSGLENLPNGPFILSSNHQSYIDPIFTAGVVSRDVLENSFAVGTSDIFGKGIMRKLARWIRVIVLDPDANLVPAMRAGAYGLRHGRVLFLYPEGERSIDGTPRIFKKGAAILSIHLQVPIVPVAIEGFYDAWPRGAAFFRKIAPLKIVFGKPIVPPPESEASEQAYEKLTADLKARVVEMWEGLRSS